MKYVFVHGGPGMKDYLKKFFLSDFLDGIFYSQNSNIGTIDEAVNELSHITHKLNNYILVGHSWGGTLSLEYIKRNLTPKPKALVLISSPISHQCNKAFDQHMENLGLKNPTPYDIFLSKKEKEHIESRTNLEEILSSLNLDTFNKIDKSYLQNFDSQNILKEARLPVLIIFGSEDHRLPSEYQKKYIELNPHLKICEIQQAGHFPFLENEHREEISKLIYSFSNTTKNPTSS